MRLPSTAQQSSCSLQTVSAIFAHAPHVFVLHSTTMKEILGVGSGDDRCLSSDTEMLPQPLRLPLIWITGA